MRLFSHYKSEVFSVALISCPECGKQVSDSAISCPHCGGQLLRGPVPTKIGELKKSPAVGLIMLVFGSVLFFVSLLSFMLFLPLAIVLSIPAVALIFQGSARFFGVRLVCCPHCGKSIRMFDTARSFKCPKCGQKSSRDGDFLNPIL